MTILIMNDHEARSRFTKLTVACPGAKRAKTNQKEWLKLVCCSTGLEAKQRTRVQGSENWSARIAANLERSMHEKSKGGVRTFALTADVAEAYRQVPIDERDWHLLGRQVESGQSVYVNSVGHMVSPRPRTTGRGWHLRWDVSLRK